MKTIALLLAASFTASPALADQQKDSENTFNGFGWGEKIGPIITHHREKSDHLQSKFNYMFLKNPDKSISGFKVEEIRYYFDPLPHGDIARTVKCNERTQEVYEWYCQLYRGSYNLESGSEQAFEKIKLDLDQKYGTPEKEIKTAPLYDRRTGEILTNREWTIYKYLRPAVPVFLQQESPRESIVHLWKLNYDKDYINPKTNRLVKAGLAQVTVDYRSDIYAFRKKRLQHLKNVCREGDYGLHRRKWEEICKSLRKL